MKLDKCLCCDGELDRLLDWGNMPLANNYNIKELFPLKLNKCKACFHLQLDEYVDPEILFKDYPYHSGTSQTSRDYFKEFAEIALRIYPEAKNVLDIASNDGSQLDAFKDFGLRTTGIDPANNLAEVARKKGHNIWMAEFPNTKPSASEYPYDIITAQNVVAHVPNPLEFLKGCKEIMHDESILMVATSQANMIVHDEFDTIYHEHISYFNTNSMRLLCERAGLFLEDVFTHSIHGTSYIFVIRKVKKQNPVEFRVELETKYGLYREDTYQTWLDNCKAKYEKTKAVIESYREKGYLIVGCGAAAKGITFLNVSKTKMDIILDTTPAKWYGETCETGIYPFESIRSIKQEKVLFVILAWNFQKEITENVLKFRNNSSDVFITTNE